MSPKRPFNITLEEDEIQILRILEELTSISASAHIRRAIKLYLRTQADGLVPQLDAEIKRRRSPKRRRE